MTDDEQAIHDLLAEWHQATTDGDVDTVLSLMSDDALFLVCGREPFGKEAFAAASRQQHDMAIEGKSSIEELEVAGPWAWMRTRIEVTMTPPNGDPISRAGSTLTILRKGDDGQWRLARDANFLPPPS